MTDRQLAQIIWDYMCFEQPLNPADIILGLGSSDIRTAEWCAALWKRNLAPSILFSGSKGSITKDRFNDSEAEIFASKVIELGVPASAVLIEKRSTNTGENIKFSYDLLMRMNRVPSKIILVTKPYMLRRAYATFMRQWPDAGRLTVICSAIPISLEEYCDDKSQSLEHTINVMIGDLQRIIKYPSLGLQINQNVPEDVYDAYYNLIDRGYVDRLIEEKV